MRHIEDSIQRMVVNYLRINGVFVFAVPNGGTRSSKKEGHNLKLSGVTAGVSDLIILLPKRAVFVEMKTKEGKQTESQKDFEAKVKKLGFEYYVWRDINDAQKFLIDYKNRLTYKES